MIIHSKIAKFATFPPYALIIGNFDGLHLGHHLLIKRAKELVGPKGTLGAITFTNHPSQVLKYTSPSLLITTKDHKVKLMEEAGVQELFLLEFTPELAAKKYDTFLTEVKMAFPFEHLIRGKGDALGSKREGDEIHVRELGEKLDFQAEYLEKFKVGGDVVSSAKIREAIKSADFAKAKALLGRPYSIYGLFENNSLSVHGLCIPPAGFYDVCVKREGKTLTAQAEIDVETIKLIFKESSSALNDLNVEIIFGEK